MNARAGRMLINPLARWLTIGNKTDAIEASLPHALEDLTGPRVFIRPQVPASSIGTESNVGARSIGGESVIDWPGSWVS